MYHFYICISFVPKIIVYHLNCPWHIFNKDLIINVSNNIGQVRNTSVLQNRFHRAIFTWGYQ